MDHCVGQRRDDSPTNAVEASLLAAFRQGDPEAFQPLVRPHLAPLLALARRHCRDLHWADDLVQETLVRAFRGLATFRGDSALRTWLFRILLRLAAEPSRWQLEHRAADLQALEVPDGYGASPPTGAIANELAHRLDAAMERLPPRQRTALHLRAVEGMDYAAVAAVLECSQPAARMLVLEARRKVLERLREHLSP
jgi:RNA polymerase sigma-70 factor (ECF subfamily)